MPDYKNAVIYMLEPSIEYDNGDIYYGSTTQPLYKRFFQHKQGFRCDREYKSKLLFEKYGIENVKIILIKYFSCETKQELEAEEAKYIRENKCVNICIPGRSIKEWRETNKEILKEKIKVYNENNKEKISKIKKEYREKYSEQIRDKKKKFREMNEDKIKVKDKMKYEKNKDKILEKLKEIIKCDCGCDTSKCHLIRHQKTNKHIKLMNAIYLKAI
jgi:hypothetical protein